MLGKNDEMPITENDITADGFLEMEQLAIKDHPEIKIKMEKLVVVLGYPETEIKMKEFDAIILRQKLR
jgi:hypothetical protein